MTWGQEPLSQAQATECPSEGRDTPQEVSFCRVVTACVPHQGLLPGEVGRP